jgi:dienelactone hydrolase
MYAWETALTTRDENRVVRPLAWGFDHLADVCGTEAAEQVARGEVSAAEAMKALNERLVARPEQMFGYETPTDFRLEERHPELFPTNVRPETLEQAAEYKRRAEVGELRRAPFLRFTSPVQTQYPENDQVNARWYEAKPAHGERPRQAMIVMPQWNADAFSHNALCEMFLRWGVSSLRLSKPYHDIRRPAELERSDYAVSANVGRTIQAARQAVADIRACVDWLAAQGYTEFGVLGTSLGSCYAYLAAAMDPRLRVCAFNHASTHFGDVVWDGQSTRHIRAAFEEAGLDKETVQAVFRAISPSSWVERYAATSREAERKTLVVYATYDLTFPREGSLAAVQGFRDYNIQHVAKVLPCGHYTTGEFPYKYLDGWYLGSFVWREFRELKRRRAG